MPSSDSHATLRDLVERITNALDLDATVEITEGDEEIQITVEGEDLGLFIGKHGSTIDAVQLLASRVASRESEDLVRVVVDAAGYRERRADVLKRMADGAAEDALSLERAVELEPMSSYERRLVHQHLSERVDVQTHSEGDEPERRLVISPVASR